MLSSQQFGFTSLIPTKKTFSNKISSKRVWTLEKQRLHRMVLIIACTKRIEFILEVHGKPSRICGIWIERNCGIQLLFTWCRQPKQDFRSHVGEQYIIFLASLIRPDCPNPKPKAYSLEGLNCCCRLLKITWRNALIVVKNAVYEGPELQWKKVHEYLRKKFYNDVECSPCALLTVVKALPLLHSRTLHWHGESGIRVENECCR